MEPSRALHPYPTALRPRPAPYRVESLDSDHARVCRRSYRPSPMEIVHRLRGNWLGPPIGTVAFPPANDIRHHSTQRIDVPVLEFSVAVLHVGESFFSSCSSARADDPARISSGLRSLRV